MPEIPQSPLPQAIVKSTVDWAKLYISGVHLAYLRAFKFRGLNHWSREYEYPWVMEHGSFGYGQLVLDAGGGNACCLLQHAMADLNCFVVNVDIDPEQLARNDFRTLYEVGDIQNLPHLDNSFYKVTCVSVLEHVPNPKKALAELWRVLKPGGRLLVTLDVTDRLLDGDDGNHTHGITLAGAEELLQYFGLTVPPLPEGLITHTIEGTDPPVTVSVLCFCADKPGQPGDENKKWN